MEKLLKILREPISGSELFQKSQDSLESTSGKVYSIQNGVIFLIPEIAANYIEHYQTDSEYFDYFAVSEDKVNIEDERRLRRYVDSKLGTEPKVILDAGSGGVWAAKRYSEKADIFVSLDIGIENLKKARIEVPSQNHFCVAGDILNLPFADNSFDAIICSEVIEHVENPELMIRSLYKALKPGGKLIVTTPYKERLQYYICVHCNKPTPRNAHIRSFDETKLSDYASRLTGALYKTHIFGNKGLIFSRSYVITKYFPFLMWKFVDKLASLILPKNAHILLEILKNSPNS